jgi:hypothetical protein
LGLRTGLGTGRMGWVWPGMAAQPTHSAVRRASTKIQSDRFQVRTVLRRAAHAGPPLRSAALLLREPHTLRSQESWPAPQSLGRSPVAGHRRYRQHLLQPGSYCRPAPARTTGQVVRRPRSQSGSSLDLRRPRDGVVESVVIVRGRARTRYPVALRLEGLDNRWRATRDQRAVEPIGPRGFWSSGAGSSSSSTSAPLVITRFAGPDHD